MGNPCRPFHNFPVKKDFIAAKLPPQKTLNPLKTIIFCSWHNPRNTHNRLKCSTAIIREAPMLDNITRQPPTKLKSGKNLLRGKWLNDADEVFSYLERHRSHDSLESKKDSWWQSMSATLTLLKQAHEIILQSEKRIEELQRLSGTDELTGIMNRRGFMQAFSRELDRVNRNKSQGGLLVMIDLDNFKSINDTFGHEAGDAALKLIAATLVNDIRVMDVAGRMGGDEFTILFVNTTRKEALERAQFLIKRLNNLSFIWDGKEINLHASLGLKEYGKGAKAANIFNAADASMYENKRQLQNLRIKQDNKVM